MANAMKKNCEVLEGKTIKFWMATGGSVLDWYNHIVLTYLISNKNNSEFQFSPKLKKNLIWLLKCLNPHSCQIYMNMTS